MLYEWAEVIAATGKQDSASVEYSESGFDVIAVWYTGSVHAVDQCWLTSMQIIYAKPREPYMVGQGRPLLI